MSEKSYSFNKGGEVLDKKYYGVKNGKTIGVFEGTWKDIDNKIIKNHPNVRVEGFDDKLKAYEYVYGTPKKIFSDRQNLLVPNPKENRERLARNLVYDPDNIEHHKKRKINVVVVGHQKNLEENKPGYFEYFLEDNLTHKIEGFVADEEFNLTANAAVIKGVIMIVKKLKIPCHLKLYTKAHLGIKKMINGNKSPNQQILSELKDLLLDGKHVIEATANTVETEKN